ncbi:MAG: hypothetical protein WC340_07385 [Kiritimatiellia bacterium]
MFLTRVTDIQSIRDGIKALHAETHEGRRKRKRRTIFLVLGGALLCGITLFFVYQEAALFATLVGGFLGFVVSRVLVFALPHERALGKLLREKERNEESLARALTSIDEKRHISELSSISREQQMRREEKEAKERQRWLSETPDQTIRWSKSVC